MNENEKKFLDRSPYPDQRRKLMFLFYGLRPILHTSFVEIGSLLILLTNQPTKQTNKQRAWVKSQHPWGRSTSTVA